MKKIYIFLFIILFPFNIKALDNISILYYKNIDNCEYETCINNTLFNLQMNYLKVLNYNPISLDEFIKWRNQEIELNDKSVLIIIENKNESLKNLNNIKLNYLNNFDIRFINLNKSTNKFDTIDEIPVYLIKNTFNSNDFLNIINNNYNNEIISNDYAFEIPVLNYHFLGSCNEIICLHQDKFEEHLKYLKEHNYKTLTLNEYIAWKYGKIELPRKSVLITFDDGAAGTSKINGNYLIPLLEKYDAHATLFLITSFWDISNYISPNLEIESHTDNLHDYASCGYKAACTSNEDIKKDIEKSISIINSHKAFAYPFYYFNNSIISILKDLDFKIAFAGGGYNSKRSDNNYLIPRQIIYDNITLEEFISIIE